MTRWAVRVRNRAGTRLLITDMSLASKKVVSASPERYQDITPAIPKQIHRGVRSICAYRVVYFLKVHWATRQGSLWHFSFQSSSVAIDIVLQALHSHCWYFICHTGTGYISGHLHYIWLTNVGLRGWKSICVINTEMHGGVSPFSGVH